MTSIKYDNPACYPQIFEPGTYYIILYGAQGGQCTSTVPYGGYTSGILRITSTTTYYACVGGKGNKGTSGSVKGGFNGGGDASFGAPQEGHCAGGGGGRSDRRRIEDDPDSVIIVAGGGGGDGSYTNAYSGGRGGAFIAEDGKGVGDRAGKGATKSSYGFGGQYEGTEYYDPCVGENGQRNKGGNAVTTGAGSAGGGGGGYYGGGGAADYGGGGGGSSFISPIFIYGKTGFSTNSGDGSIIIIPNFHYYTPKRTNNYRVFVLVVIYFVSLK